MQPFSWIVHITSASARQVNETYRNDKYTDTLSHIAHLHPPYTLVLVCDLVEYNAKDDAVPLPLDEGFQRLVNSFLKSKTGDPRMTHANYTSLINYLS